MPGPGWLLKIKKISLILDHHPVRSIKGASRYFFEVAMARAAKQPSFRLFVQARHEDDVHRAEGLFVRDLVKQRDVLGRFGCGKRLEVGNDVPQFLIRNQLFGVRRHGTRGFANIPDQPIGIQHGIR